MATLEIRTLTINELAEFFARQVTDNSLSKKEIEQRARVFHGMLKEYTGFGGIYRLDAGSNQIFKTPHLRKRNFSADYLFRVLPPGNWESFMISVNNKRVPIQLASGDDMAEGVLYKAQGKQGDEYFIEGFHLGDSDEDECDCFDEDRYEPLSSFGIN